LIALGLLPACRQRVWITSVADAAAPPDTGPDGPSIAPGFFSPPAADAAPLLCQRLACRTAGGQYCGAVADGCGGVIDCGDCPAGQRCGTGDRAHLCISADPA